MSSENAGEILDFALGGKIAAKIEELIPILEDHRNARNPLNALSRQNLGSLPAGFIQGILRKPRKIFL